MPWSEASVKEQKLLFVADCLREEASMTLLCEGYGISRETGYVWKRRFLQEGPGGLDERSRAPLRHGRETPAELVVPSDRGASSLASLGAQEAAGQAVARRSAERLAKRQHWLGDPAP